MKKDEQTEIDQPSVSVRDLTIFIESYSQELDNIFEPFKLRDFINSRFLEFTKHYLEITKGGIQSVDPQLKYLFSYELPELYKDYSILHRNVLLELIKGHIQVQDGVLSFEQQKVHFEQSKTVLLGATSDLLQDMHSIFNTGQTKKIKNSLSLLQSPWGVYEEQFQVLVEQLGILETSELKLSETSKLFGSIRNIITVATSSVEIEQQRMYTVLCGLLEKIEKNPTHKELALIIEEEIREIPKRSDKQNKFSADISTQINALSSVAVPINTIDGTIQIREENLPEDVQLWMDYRILPFFVDLWAMEDKLIFSLKKMLHDLSDVLEEDLADQEITLFLSAINNLKRKFEGVKPKMERFVKEIDLLGADLTVSSLYKNDSFLEIPFEPNLKQRQRSLSKSLMLRLNKLKRSLSLKQTHYENLNPLELASQCMAHRMRQKADGHYDALFLNKRFIGDLFLISRAKEEQKMANAIVQWQEGFSKAILVTGERLSGKTTFIDYTAKKFFGKDILFLTPNSPATIDGRKFRTTTDLKAALNYINENNARSTQPVIVIDDIELWRGETHTMVDNVRALIDFIELLEGRALVIVSATPVLKAHLDKRFNFSNVFSTLIEVDFATKEELANVFLLRHGASHRILVDKLGEPVSREKLKDLMVKVGRRNNNNIGLALQCWTHQIKILEENKVAFSKMDFGFYDFFTNEETLVLKHVLMYRKVTIFELKKVAKISYNHQFKSAIRRLLNTKVLIREGEFLMINPVVLGDVLKILTKKSIFPKI